MAAPGELQTKALVQKKFVICTFAGIIMLVIVNICGRYASREKRAQLFRFQFFIIAETVVFLSGRYIYKNVVKLTEEEGCQWVISTILKLSTLSVIFGAAMSYIINLIFVSLMSSDSGDRSYIGMTSFICLGFLIQMTLCFIFINFSLFLYKSLKWLRPKFKSNTFQQTISLESLSIQKAKTRKFKFICAFCYAFLIASIGLYNSTQAPIVKHVSVPMRKLPSSMDGLRAVLISDIHLGPTVGKTQLSRIVDTINGLQPDVVLVAGDLSDGTVTVLHKAAQPLQNIKAQYGKYFVTGNHEYHTGYVDEWFGYLEKIGFTVLHNQHHRIVSKSKPDDFIYLAGVDDIEATLFRYDGHGMDLDAALSKCDRDHAVVLLAHQPRAAKVALDSQYSIQLVLSGHTHGGQMFPMTILSYLFNPFFAGLYKYKDSHVYVTQGTQYWGIPFRVWSTMEITQITLNTVS